MLMCNLKTPHLRCGSFGFLLSLLGEELKQTEKKFCFKYHTTQLLYIHISQAPSVTHFVFFSSTPPATRKVRFILSPFLFF